MSGKIVGITCGTLAAAEIGGRRQALSVAYSQAVERAGGVPILLPVMTEPEVTARYLDVLDGLLLSGGVDIAPVRYGQEPHPKLGEVDADRDATELPLLREALARDLPVFGICRGIQTLNVALGGTLYQDLPSESPSDIHHQQGDRQIPRSQPSHPIRITPGSRLRAIVGAEEMPVNSMHHQALREVAEELIVSACAADGVIEAVEMPSRRYVVAVQFHPEETAPQDEKSRRLFEAFVAVL
jgi:putative glutamine amidotransferase